MGLRACEPAMSVMISSVLLLLLPAISHALQEESSQMTNHTWSSGDIYTGGWQDGQPAGKGTLWLANDEVKLEGFFQGGIFTGNVSSELLEGEMTSSYRIEEDGLILGNGSGTIRFTDGDRYQVLG